MLKRKAWRVYEPSGSMKGILLKADLIYYRSLVQLIKLIQIFIRNSSENGVCFREADNFFMNIFPNRHIRDISSLAILPDLHFINRMDIIRDKNPAERLPFGETETDIPGTVKQAGIIKFHIK